MPNVDPNQITFRTGLGRELTFEEVDENFNQIKVMAEDYLDSFVFFEDMKNDAEQAADDANDALGEIQGMIPPLTGNARKVFTVADNETDIIWYGREVSNVASTGTLTPNAYTHKQYNVTNLSANLTIQAPTGDYLEGDTLLFRVKDNGSIRSITWNGVYRAVGVVLPIETVESKTVYIGCVYNGADSRWDVIAVALEE